METESGSFTEWDGDRFSLIVPADNSHSGSAKNDNLIVAFCLDGTVYALDGESGVILWKTVGSFTDGPLLRKRRKGKGSTAEGDEGGYEYLVEPLGDGAIFQVTKPEEEIKRLPFTLKSLVHLSPVHWQESEERALYLIAKRESSIFVLDMMNGRVQRRQFSQLEGESEVEIAPLERATLLVGRTDYHVQGFDEGTLEADWEIILTQFKSLHAAETSSASEDPFYTTFNGHLVSKQRDGPWIAQLGSPVLQIFKPVVTTKGFITLQEIELKGNAKADSHVLFDRNKATFYFDDLVNVGVLHNETAMFALPQSHYPLLKGEQRRRSVFPGNELVLASRHEFVSVRRVTRQSIPAPMKLLDYDGKHNTNVIYGTVFVSLMSMLLFVYLRLFKKSKRKLRESALQVSEQVLGFGSHGTVVFRGEFDGRPVAVKRLLAEFYSLADREISLLQAHDSHPNVIRYFYREQQERFILVALELAQCSLYEFIDPEEASERSGKDLGLNLRVDRVDLLRQIMLGVAFLHEKGLIHRDLKPQNILLQKEDRDDGVKVLISDFGLSRKVVEMESSFHATAKAAGTLGWRAPEIIFNEESESFRASESGVGPMKIGKSVDIFAVGLVFYFVLSEGKHAFGSRLIRESNISQGRLQTEELEKLSVEAKDLIMKMLKRNGKERPTAEEVLRHPFFWSSEKRLEFICAVSDVLEAEEQFAKKEQAAEAPPGFTGQVVDLPMRDAIDMINIRDGPKSNTWHKNLDRTIFQDLTKHRFYMVNKVHDLLRAIRNKRNHFHETPVEVKAIIGGNTAEAWEYFEALYPKLLMESYQVMRQFHPSALKKYF